ncbi:uncharacterized protein SAPINGB_P000005 [Magnusiomyces paraingens]|uniref:C2H2-type domain-containing protein n=1 Tax=Magnusiomyces paraingens TaxID=2606893 RepID=A0A5E8AWE4_9ASCO|nr:uncharacterized protein SAPINGB_P000005 [Saprochaete ingens]VVT43481.1 unnamed protein product [Saprochaete ingens]
MEVTISRGASDGGIPLFTCNTCGLSFPTADLQRLHMKTEWHRYNLKRRVAQLPPISAEIFAEKALQNQQEESDHTKKGNRGGKRQVTKKDKRLEEKQKRRLASNLAAQEALDSAREQLDNKRSIDLESVDSSTFSLGDPISTNKTQIDTDTESISEISDTESSYSLNDKDLEDEEGDDEIDREIKRRLRKNKPIPPNVCFMTGRVFPSPEENAEHLRKHFGLFIPEREYLTDLTGLMTYLGEKIGLGNMCLYCNFESRSLEAVRAHMIAKRHIKIPYETMDEKLEISDFYDFRGSYKKETNETTIVKGADDDDEWEDESASESDEELSEGDYEDAAVVLESGLELAMGNLRAGHRSLARYYKQNLPYNIIPEDQGTLIAADRRANNLVKERDPVREKLRKQAVREQNMLQNRERRRETKTVNFQTHYRDQLLQ